MTHPYTVHTTRPTVKKSLTVHHMQATDHADRIRAAIRECDRFIALEESRGADLRPPDVAELLAIYINHRAQLVAALDRTPAPEA